jgi:serine/threonine protein kinase
MDEANALRTIAGTPEFLAPEIAGFFAPNSRRNNGSYTLAVDVWSIGMIAFWILTGELPFESQSHLSAYVMGKIRFPSGRILAKSSSHLACDFTENLTVPDPGRRLTVKQALQHAWVRSKVCTQPSVGAQYRLTNYLDAATLTNSLADRLVLAKTGR